MSVRRSGCLGPVDRLVIDRQQLDQLTSASLEDTGKRLAKALGKKYLAFSRQITGTYVKPIDLPAGRYALVEQEGSITLVKWSMVLERYRGQQVTAQLRGRSVTWQFARTPSLPPR